MKIKINQIILLTPIFILVVMQTGMQKILDISFFGTYVIAPSAFLMAVIANNFKFSFISNKFFMAYLALITYAILMLFVSVNADTAVQEIQTMFFCLMCIATTIEFISNDKRKNITVILYFLVIAKILIDITLISSVASDEIMSNSREFDLNANTYSYNSFYALLAAILIDLEKGAIKSKLLIVLVVLLGLYVATITASRQALIIIPLALFYFIFNSSLAYRYKDLSFIVISTITVSLSGKINDFIESTLLFQRSNSFISSGNDTRLDLMTEGVDVFLKYFPLGAGPAQFIEVNGFTNQFSHNSYIESAANFGVFGLILILALYLYPIVFIAKRYSSFKNTRIPLLVVAFSIVIYNNFYVFYLYPISLIFLIAYLEYLGRSYRMNKISD